MIQSQRNLKETVAKNINNIMVEQGKSRRQVCNDLEIKYTTFCDWVNAKSSPKLEALEALAEYFGVEVADFFVDINAVVASDKSINSYLKLLGGEKMLERSTFEKLSDDEVKVLLNAGFRLRHKSLEEYIEESGRTFIASEEVDWGEPVGEETW